MSKCILITRPRHDDITNVLYFWTSLVIDEAEKKRFIVLDLYGDKANKNNFLSYISKNKPSLLFLNGHGSDARITGHDNETLVDDKDTRSLNNKVIYARSCNAAKKLGDRCTKEGAVCFIGYKNQFFLGHNEDKTTKPLEDHIAQLFIEPSNLIPISLIKGHTTQQAYEKSQIAMLKNIQRLLSTKATDEEVEALPYLNYNRISQVIIGDLKATI